MRKQNGFTLIEILVVVTVMAVLASAVTLSLPSSEQRELARQADKLSAQLEVWRAKSRATGLPVKVRIEQQAYIIQTIDGMNSNTWDSEHISATPTQFYVGPEAIIGEQSIVLVGAKGTKYQVRTDGVGPFETASGHE